MKCSAETIPIVAPMMVRSFVILKPKRIVEMFGGVLVVDGYYEVEDVGMATERLGYDEDVVDCSNRIFQLTTCMMSLKDAMWLTAFPSRRWRNFRTGDQITGYPTQEAPLLYIGNPIRLVNDPVKGIGVFRMPEFLIKSGCQMGY
jgi:hypothetical protein